jgi:hypothetical protein
MLHTTSCQNKTNYLKSSFSKLPQRLSSRYIPQIPFDNVVLTSQSDRVFFVYLRGDLPESNKVLVQFDKALVDATLTVSSSIIYADGSHDEERSVTFPLKTTPFSDYVHIVIRDPGGAQVDYYRRAAAAIYCWISRFLLCF